MGTEMLVIVECEREGEYVQIEEFRAFRDRDYNLFGFLADVRNEMNVPPISQPRGIPSDSPIYGLVEDGKPDVCYWSWLSIAELEAFDYDATFPEGPPQFDHPASLPRYRPVEGGQSRRWTFREVLGPGFFRDLELLKSVGAARILIAFHA